MGKRDRRLDCSLGDDQVLEWEGTIAIIAYYGSLYPVQAAAATIFVKLQPGYLWMEPVIVCCGWGTLHL